MAGELATFRKQNPEYDDLSDVELVRGLQGRYNADNGRNVSFKDFADAIDFPVTERDIPNPAAPAAPATETVPPADMTQGAAVQDEMRAPASRGPSPGVSTSRELPTIAEAEDQVAKFVAGRPTGAVSRETPELATSAITPPSKRLAEQETEARKAAGENREAFPESPFSLTNVAARVMDLGAAAVPLALALHFGKSAEDPLDETARGAGAVASGALAAGGGMLGYVGLKLGSEAAQDVADDIEDVARELMPPDPDFIDQVGAGFGSSATFWIPGVGIARGAQAVAKVSTTAALWGGAFASGVMEAMAEAGNSYSQNIERGLSPEEAEARADDVFFANSAVVGLMNRFGFFSGAGIARARSLLIAAVEGTQEYFQQVIGNVATDRPLTEGALKAAAIGGIVGKVSALATPGGVLAPEASPAPAPTTVPPTDQISPPEPSPEAAPSASPALPPSGTAGPASVGESATPTAPGPIDQFPRGDPAESFTPRGEDVPAVYRLVPVEDLITSNDDAGNVNPAYPADLQPRDRSRAASRSQVANIANNLRVDALLGAGDVARGAPTVGADLVVESGNGRIMGLRRALRDERGDAYRAILAERAEEFGFTRVQVEADPTLVLVRQRQGDVDRAEFARQANESTSQAFSSAEQAGVDAARMNDDDLAIFNPSEDGNVLASSNQPFLRGFLQKMSKEEAAGLMDKEGRPTRQLAERINAAIFAKVYGDERLIALQAEAADPEIRNILNALQAAAPAFAKARSVDANLGGMDLPSAIAEGAELVRTAKQAGQAVDEYLNQQDAFADPIRSEAAGFALFMAANNRSARRMGQAFRTIGEFLETELRGRETTDIFGKEAASINDLIRAVNKEIEKQNAAENKAAGGAIPDLFGANPPRIAAARAPQSSREPGGGGRESAEQQGAAARGTEKVAGTQPQSPRGTPSRRKVSSETPPARPTSATVAPPGDQALEVGSQVSTRAEPSGISATRETAPSTIEGGIATGTLGTIDKTSRRIINQGSADVDVLARLATDSRGALETELRTIADGIPGATFLAARVKNRAGLDAKIAQGRPANTVSDYLGARIAADSREGLDAIVAAVGAQYPIVENENFLNRPKRGYRAIHLQVEFRPGFTVEIQVAPKQVAEVVEEAHAVYDQWKRVTRLTPKQVGEHTTAMRKMERLFNKAWDAFQATPTAAPQPRAQAAGAVEAPDVPLLRGRPKPEPTPGPGGAKKAPSGFGVLKTPIAPDKPMRREKILRDLERAIGVKIYQGRVKGKKSRLGFYRPFLELLRIRHNNDLEVTAHEIAHYMDDTDGAFSLLYRQKPYATELRGMAYKGASNKLSEGFAEFMRAFLTQEATAVSRAPLFYDAFVRAIQNTRWNTPLVRAQADMHAWYQQGALNRGKSKVGPEDIKFWDWFTGAVKHWDDKSIAAVWDNLQGFKVAERELTGSIGDAEVSIYKAARLTRGIRGVQHAVLNHGTIGIARGGEVFTLKGGLGRGKDIKVTAKRGDILFTGIGLREVFEPVADDLKNTMLYFVGRRAAELKGQGRENLLEDDEIAAFLALGETNPKIPVVHDAYQEFLDRMMDFYEDAGIISPEARVKMQEMNKDYVPFHRILQEATGEKLTRGFRPFKRLRGGTANIRDVWENITGSTQSLIDASVRNLAKRRIYDLIDSSRGSAKYATKIPTDIKTVRVQADQVRKILNKVGVVDAAGKPMADAILDTGPLGEAITFFTFGNAPIGDNIDTVMRKGRREFYEIGDPIFLKAAMSWGFKPTHWIVRAMGGTKRIFTFSVTANPSFWGVNMTRDMFNGWSLKRSNMLPVVDSLRGFVDRMKQDDAYWIYMANGGGYGTVAQTEARNLNRRLERLYLDSGVNPKNVIHTPARLLDWWTEVGASFEEGTRLAEMKASLRQGKSLQEGTFRGRDVSTDFAMRGYSDFVRFFITTVPFLNARQQGLYKNARELFEQDGKMRKLPKGDNAGRVVTRSLLGFTLPSLLLWWFNHDDERYKRLPNWVKDLNWVIFWGPGEEQFILIPKPFEQGALWATLPERSLELLVERDGERFGEAIMWILSEMLNFSLMPQVLAPIDEARNNENFTGGKVIPDDLIDVDPTLQFRPWTSDTAIFLGEHTGTSPLLIESYVKGYFATLGAWTFMATDSLLEAANLTGRGEIPPKDFAEFEVIRRFTRSIPLRGTSYEDQFWDLKEQVRQVTRSFAVIQARGGDPAQYIKPADRQVLFAVSNAVDDIAKELTKMNKQVRLVRNSRVMTGEAKKAQLKALQAARNELFERAAPSLSRKQMKALQKKLPGAAELP